jgi:hypothetical protein
LGPSALASVRHFGENNSRYFRRTKARWKANSVYGFTVIAVRTSRRGTISNAQVRYQSVNGDGSSHSVWMNVAGLTAKTQLPVTPVFSIYGVEDRHPTFWWFKGTRAKLVLSILNRIDGLLRLRPLQQGDSLSHKAE